MSRPQCTINRPGKLEELLLLLLILFGIIGIISSSELGAASRYDKAVKRWVLELSSDADVKKRVEAADSLGYHNTPESLSALADALINDKSERVRKQAASSLWKHSPKIKQAEPALQRSLSDPFPAVRVYSSWALQNAGVKARDLTAPRRSALADDKASVSIKFWAAYGLIGFDPPPQLVQHLLAYVEGRLRSKPADNAFRKLAKQNDRGVVAPMEQIALTYHKGNSIVLRGLQNFSPQPEKLVDLLCLQFDFKDIELDREIIGLLSMHGEKEPEVRKLNRPRLILF